MELRGVRAVLGGPEFRVRYPNGGETSYVSTVFDAHVVAGVAHPDGDETLDAAWFNPGQLARAELNGITRALLCGAGVLPGDSSSFVA